MRTSIVSALVLVLGMNGLASVNGTPAEIAPEAPAVIDTAPVYALLTEARNNRQKIGADEAAATDFFTRMNGMIGSFADNPNVSRHIIAGIAPLGMQGGIFARTETVKAISRFTDNEHAVAALLTIMKTGLGKGQEFNDFLTAVCTGIAGCGRFSDQAAKGLMEVFSTKSGDIPLKVKEAAFAAYGNVRTLAAVETLIYLLAKICPYPEDPNPYIHHRHGDDIKHQMWQTLNVTYYASLNSLTGENQTGDAVNGIYWRLSQWKSWFKKNQALLAKKFVEEKAKALLDTAKAACDGRI